MIIWTGSHPPSENLKKKTAFNCLWLPSIQKQPYSLNSTISKELSQFDLSCLSSSFSLKCLLQDQSIQIEDLKKNSWLAVGRKTECYASKLGLKVVATFDYGDEIPDWCKKNSVKSILSFGAEKRAFNLKKNLAPFGVRVKEINLYKTASIIQNSDHVSLDYIRVKEILDGHKSIVFCFLSPSAVEAWSEFLKDKSNLNEKKILFYALGKTTQNSLQSYGIEAKIPLKPNLESLEKSLLRL